MPARYKSRQRALQVLFQCDLREHGPVEGLEAYYGSLYLEEGDEAIAQDPLLEDLVHGTLRVRAEIDELIRRHSVNWRLERMPFVDRNILRMAIFEMNHVGTPAPVVIDQAIELARRFSGESSVPFINGVLDAVRREHAAASGLDSVPAQDN
ncbi:MAG: transcription antitermination factor NusB [Bryobacterales bacterium]|nr:transcription antitermination factor NusB [Bryobacterales bacterium]